ncbi:MAG: insulinase family protein [Elusimicrobiota bacterium]
MRTIQRVVALSVVILASFTARISALEAWEKGSRLPKLVPAPLADDGLKVTVHRLKNGLTVYLSPNHEMPRISAWIATRAGSRHDPADSTGMAHYLEHMFFKGSRKLGTLDYPQESKHLDAIYKLYEELFVTTDTAKRKEIYGRIDRENIAASKYAVPNELDKTYKSLGFKGINAFTSNEMTVYLADLPKNRLDAWAKLESDRFKSPVFRLFQTELETVYEEKNRSNDNPDRILFEALDKALYGAHPYGRTTLGSIEHLKNPSLAKMYAFAAKNYVPNNMAIALAGDFDREDALKLLDRFFDSWAPRPVETLPAYELPQPTAPVRVEVRYEAPEMAVAAWPMPAYSHPDNEELEVLSLVLYNSQSGIMDLDINQAQKVREAAANLDLMNEGGSLILYAVPKDGQTLEETETLLLAAAAKLKSGDFSEEDLGGIVTNYEIGEKRKLESNDSRVREMAMSFLRYEEWPSAAGRLERIKKVTKADVVRVANAYLGEGRVTALRRRGKPEIPTIAKPGFTKIDIARDRESGFYKELVRMPAKPIEPRWLAEGRDYRVLKAPWGELVTAKNPFNDLFSLRLQVELGRLHEKQLCAAFKLWNLSGAGPLSAEALKKKLFSLGTTLEAQCSEQSASVSVEGLEANLAESLRLMRERFEDPNIAPDTLQKMVEVMIGEHKDNKVDPGEVFNALREWAGRGKESAVLAELSDAELKALDETRLKAILAKLFDIEHRAGYVGARKPEEVLSLLDKPGRKSKPAPEHKPLRYSRPAAPEVVFTHRDMIQSQFGFHAADEVYDPAKAVDYQFYADYMGGGMSSVIFQEVREARSLAYAAKGGYGTAPHQGDENMLWAFVGTQADKTLEASTLVDSLLSRMPASQDRFKETKKSIEERYRTSPTPFRAVPSTVLYWEDMGFAKDPRPERFQRSLRYGLKDLEGFAKRFESMPKTLYILGNRSRVDLEGLKKLGSVMEKPLDELFPY